ncbi:MAG: hypothetical protein IH900_10150 [Proteobacteria bacterium]|nr:hypothetical protein [Pseudomonadota bacterium]
MGERGAADGTGVRLEAAQAALRDHFLGWQCRLRQMAVRQAGGRPTSGMRPEVRLAEADKPLGAITTLIVRREPREATAQFRHLVRKTQDPAERYDAALETLAAAYYQRPREFSDELTALFGPAPGLADQLLAAGRCVLDFAQYSQRYRLPCAARNLGEDEPAFQATYWHNALFNPALPGGVRVLGFQPDWARAEAEPGVG